ncbi:MAG: hypothetical protein K9N11_09790 [Lentisphaeria bacterium]|nr:hypothetical protein [Lentisphaeria bacterium]
MAQSKTPRSLSDKMGFSPLPKGRTKEGLGINATTNNTQTNTDEEISAADRADFLDSTQRHRQGKRLTAMAQSKTPRSLSDKMGFSPLFKGRIKEGLGINATTTRTQQNTSPGHLPEPALS